LCKQIPCIRRTDDLPAGSDGLGVMAESSCWRTISDQDQWRACQEGGLILCGPV
jgi:hypothetical protein